MLLKANGSAGAIYRPQLRHMDGDGSICCSVGSIPTRSTYHLSPNVLTIGIALTHSVRARMAVGMIFGNIRREREGVRERDTAQGLHGTRQAWSHRTTWLPVANSEPVHTSHPRFPLKPNKTSLLTPDPPPVPAVMTATTSTPCSTLAPGQA